ncbi:MAG: RdgB/HAM1 family non-canonical purine NTP pyrophosphatase [Mariprofundaceae bacterium]
MRLVIASNNAKKRAEITAVLDRLGMGIVPAEQTSFVEVVEDGDSFSENARKKAEAFARANHLPALADDSGLCVDALDGAPGVYSSRFAGEHAADAENNARLLTELAGSLNRDAHFTCAIHLSFADGRQAVTASGEVRGVILEQAKGTGGFGYDPLFYCPELGKSFALAGPEEKARVSHRGRALRALAEKLESTTVTQSFREKAK